MPSANYPTAAGPRGDTSGAPKPGEDEHRPEEPISPILVLPDPPRSSRPRFRRRVAAGAVSLLVLAGASLLLTGQPENSEKPAVIVDDLALARREVAQEVMAFDRRRAEFESGAAGCREFAGAYGTLDRAFVRFSTLLVQADPRVRRYGHWWEADGRLFAIVDQESAVFDRSGCPRSPSSWRASSASPRP